jgi:hypothetical protein
MYVNGKMIPIETIPGMGEGYIKRRMMEGVNSSMIHLTYCKNVSKCHTYLQHDKKFKKKKIRNLKKLKSKNEISIQNYFKMKDMKIKK